jgi:hypothetical protein
VLSVMTPIVTSTAGVVVADVPLPAGDDLLVSC